MAYSFGKLPDSDSSDVDSDIDFSVWDQKLSDYNISTGVTKSSPIRGKETLNPTVTTPQISIQNYPDVVKAEWNELNPNELNNAELTSLIDKMETRATILKPNSPHPSLPGVRVYSYKRKRVDLVLFQPDALERKRVLHINADRKTRALLQEGLTELRQSIPSVRVDGKDTKLQILKNTAQHIKILIARSEERKNQIKQQKEKLIELEEKLA